MAGMPGKFFGGTAVITQVRILTESVMAGALDVQLAGNAYYFGKLYEKPTIGDPIRLIESEDIRRANRLLYATAITGVVLFLFIRIVLILCWS